MDEDKLRLIAAESEETSSERVALKAKLEDLKAGKRVLQTQTRGSGKGMSRACEESWQVSLTCG
jgi:cell division protein FtsB